jgi:GT2 family glycosyltransferase
MSRSVSIVIPSYDGRDLLARHLPSVLAAAATVGAEVVVVDDGSRDGTVEYLRASFPAVTVVACAENRGFSATMNRGVGAAGGEVVVCVNNDVEVPPGFLPPLVRHFDDPDCFAVASRMEVDADGGNESLIRGSFRLGFLQTYRQEAPPAGVEGAVPVLYAVGAAVAYSREKFLALGGFDLLFSPFNGEDLDISYRAWKRGWRVLWEPRSVVRHEHRATIGRLYTPDFIRQTQVRARLLFAWKNVTDPWMLGAHLACLGPRTLARVARGERYFWRALRSCLRDLPAIRAARRRQRAETRRSDRDVFALVAPFAARGSTS